MSVLARTGRERGPRQGPRLNASLRSALVFWVLLWVIGFVVLHGLRISEAKTPSDSQPSAASETARSPGTQTAVVQETGPVTWTESAPASAVQRPSADASSTFEPDTAKKDVISAEQVDSIPVSGRLTQTRRHSRSPAPRTNAQATIGRLTTEPFGSKPSRTDNEGQENPANGVLQDSAFARDATRSTAISSSENSNTQQTPPSVIQHAGTASETITLSEREEELLEIVDERSVNDVPLDAPAKSVLETQSATRTRGGTAQHRPVPLKQQAPFADTAALSTTNADPSHEHRKEDRYILSDDAAASVTAVDQHQIPDGTKEGIHDGRPSNAYKTSVVSTGIASADTAMTEDSVTAAFASPTNAATVPPQTEIRYPQPLPSTALSMDAFLSLLGWRLNGHQVEQLTQQASNEHKTMDDRQIASDALEIIQEVLRLDAQLMELIPHSDRAPMLDDWWPALKERTTMEVLQLTTQLQLVRLQVEPQPEHSNPDPTPNARLFRHRLEALGAELEASFEAMMILVARGEQHLFALATPQGLNLIELHPLKERITRWRMRMQKERAILQRRVLGFDSAASPLPTTAAEVLSRQTETLSPPVTEAASGPDHSDPGQEATNTTAPSNHQTSTGEARAQPASWVTQVEQLWRTTADLVRIQEILETAADSGDALASSALARLLWFGDSERLFGPNRSRALHYLQQAVAAGQPDAHDLAATLELVNGNATSLKRALLYFHRAALDGQAHAQMVVAFRYLYGLGGLPEDCNQAVHFYRLAAAHAVHDSATTNDPSRLEQRSVPAFASKAMESELNLEREIRRRTLRFRRTMPLEAFRLSAEDAKRIRRFATQRQSFWAKMAAKAPQTISSVTSTGPWPDSAPNYPPDWLEMLRTATSETTWPTDALETTTSMHWSMFSGADTLDDERELIEYYRHAAERGDTRAQVAMGQLLLQGAPGLPPDPHQAFQYLRRAAQAGDPHAHVHLATMYSQGLGVAPNNESALWHYRVAAARREPTALNALGHLYLWGIGVERNGQEAARLFRAAAAQGHIEAKYNLGILYQNGIGVERRDQHQALICFVEAARAGHRRAAWKAALLMQAGVTQSTCIDIALSFRRVAEDGRAVRLSLERARWLVEQSGFVSSRVSRVRRRVSPEQVAAMLDEALWRTVQAAWAGVEVAQYNAALLYASWMQDEQQALQYWLLASLNGHRQAMIEAGDLLYRWQERERWPASISWSWSGVDRQRVSAVDCYRQAAELGTAEAFFNLGYLHMRGRGGAVLDLHLAQRYLEAARAIDAKEAWLAATLALFWLRLEQVWQRVPKWHRWRPGFGFIHDEDAGSFWHPYRPRVVLVLLGLLGCALAAKWWIRRHRQPWNTIQRERPSIHLHQE